MKVAEHILTGHKVAIKILNRRKIQAMDMEEKGEHPNSLPHEGPSCTRTNTQQLAAGAWQQVA